MGVAVMEAVVTSVGAILKTLECPICLELLKSPVSVGCGHFFCRECVSGFLQSQYRAPCPLCKRSFTRRSVQEAAQRQSVISAAKILANTCSSLTGVNFIAQDDTVKLCRKSDGDLPVLTKKLKSSNKNQDSSTRKRKSFENEASNEENVKEQDIVDLEVEECDKGDENSSSKKRACPDSNDDLPSLEDFLNRLKKKSPASVTNEVSMEQRLSTKPVNKTSELKTYSTQKKIQKTSTSDLFDSIKDHSESKVSSLGNCKGDTVENLKIDKNEAQKDSSVDRNNSIVPLKNKINALKNKTNEVHSNQYRKQDEEYSKQKLLRNKKKIENESVDKSKENESVDKLKENESVDKLKENECLSPSGESNNAILLKQKQSSVKKPNKINRKSIPDIASNSPIVEHARLKESEISPIPPVKNCKKKDRSTLNDVVSSLHHANSANQSVKKVVEDPFKSLGLTDTAVSVGCVASPLATKILSVNKSPGWSRVKEVKKDFKVKKFASLHVEKNSPNVSLKTTEQENVPGISKQDQSLDRIEDRVENESASAVVASHAIDNESCQVDCHEKCDSDQAQSSLLSKEVNKCITVSKNVAGPSESSNVNKSNLHEDMVEEMDCSVDDNHECSFNDPEEILNNSLKNSLGTTERRIIINNVPSVSITSNSLICAKYSDAFNTTSSQNIIKSQKIICEVQNNSLRNSEMGVRKDDVSGYVSHDNIQNCSTENKSKLFVGISELKQNALPLPHASEYQSFYSRSVHDDEKFQYVEQSQQTSQVFDFHKAVSDNLRAVVVHQPSPHFYCPPTEKTKVVKRTCLTLEEIQDYFDKSSQSGSSETICNLPFFSGLFKLHVAVSDETLNISVLRVIDPASESGTVQNNVSHFSDKCIQAPNNLFLSSTVVPSSNAASESSQPEASDPFPYLNKQPPEQKDSKSLTMLPNETDSEFIHDEMSREPDERTFPTTTESSDKENVPVKISTCEKQDLIMENDADMSEIVHFPPKPSDEIQKTSSFPADMQSDKGNYDNLNTLSDVAAVRADLVSKEYDSLTDKTDSTNQPSYITTEAEHIDSDDSDEEEISLKKLQECVHKRQSVPGKNQSRLSLKKKSVTRINPLESSDESDVETSVPDKRSSSETPVSKNLKSASAAVDFFTPKAPNMRESLKKAAQSSVAAEMPSTLNSMLSEDASEINASEIILEIEDLSDKIKSLEEKLKQVGSEELDKSVTSVRESDSEDSTADLFPQSVPPTPPKHI